MKYGGNTSCLEITCGATRIICDAGTGIRPLGNELKRKSRRNPVRAAILLSHLHWDHFVGLPFFEPLYVKKNSFVIAGPGFGNKSFKEKLYEVVSPPFFPISPDTFSANIIYKTLTGDPFIIDEVTVRPFACNHPGGSLGWKFTLPGNKTIVQVSDHEPSSIQRHDMVRWMYGADIIIHDAQYSPGEFRRFRGWGHSPYGYTVRSAIAAKAKKLVLYHHDPESSDSILERRLHHAREIALGLGSRIMVELAQEGKELVL